MQRFENTPQGQELFSPHIQDLINKSKTAPIELNDRILDAVDRLDNCDEFAVELMHILGVLANIKPVCLININESEYADEVLDIVDSLGLNYQSNQFGYSVSRYPELLDAISDAFSRKWLPDDNRNFAVDPKVEYEIGALLGYPTKSTENYLKRIDEYNQTGEWVPFSKLPAEFRHLENFAQFVVSDDPHEEIANYIQPLHDAAKIITPNIYRRLISANYDN